jgi:3-oxoacyl-[acyl-carrier protein] reductase
VIHGQSDRAAAESVRREIVDKGGNAIVHLTDLAHEQACQSLVDAAVSELGRLDILVCNAAIRRQKPFLETSFTEWREVLAVDLDSVFLMTRAAAPHIVSAGGGSMVCLGGSPSHMGTRGRSHVCEAKMGVVGLARVLANELGELARALVLARSSES